MKRSRIAVMLAVALAALVHVGCGDGDGKSAEQESHALEHATAAGSLLTLNEGEKWEMDEHTRSAIAQINATVDGVEVSGVEDAGQLGATLQTQVKQLVQGCTMEGAAHDQLHVFLKEFIPTVSTLAAASDAAAGKAALARINELLAEYGRTFS